MRPALPLQKPGGRPYQAGWRRPHSEYVVRNASRFTSSKPSQPSMGGSPAKIVRISRPIAPTAGATTNVVWRCSVCR